MTKVSNEISINFRLCGFAFEIGFIIIKQILSTPFFHINTISKF